jgi:hypothetical protein
MLVVAVDDVSTTPFWELADLYLCRELDWRFVPCESIEWSSDPDSLSNDRIQCMLEVNPSASIEDIFEAMAVIKDISPTAKVYAYWRN